MEIYFNKQIIKSLQHSIPKFMHRDNVPGLSLVLLKDQQIHWSASFGVKHILTKEPVTMKTVFEGASLTKPLVAYLTLRLVEENRIDLEKPLVSYLPELYLPDDPLAELITARHVLSHTCGFPNWRGKNPLRVQFTPGSKFSYSGEGFVYLQRVIEEILCESLDLTMKREIFEPLGMAQSSLVWRSSFAKDMASPHDQDGQPQEIDQNSEPNAAWSLLTTSTDYAKFLLEMMHTYDSRSGLISGDLLKDMLTPQVQINNTLSWGLGWGIVQNGEERSFWHWGDNGDYKNFTTFSPDSRIGIMVMTNGYHGLDSCRSILYELFGKQYPAFVDYLDKLYED